MDVVESAPTRIVEKEGAVVCITTVGIDSAKSVFPLHGVDARGRAVLSTQQIGDV